MIDAVRGPWLRRCCRHAIHRHAARTDSQIPAEGFELECADCLSHLRWTLGAWEWVPPTYLRESEPEAIAARIKRGDEITHGKFSEALAKLHAGKRSS